MKPRFAPELLLLLLRIRKHQVPPTAQWRIHKDSSDGMHSRLRWKQSGGVGKHSYLSPPKPQGDPRKSYSWLAKIPNNHLGWFWNNLVNKDKKMYHIIWCRICFMNSGQLKAWALFVVVCWWGRLEQTRSDTFESKEIPNLGSTHEKLSAESSKHGSGK